MGWQVEGPETYQLNKADDEITLTYTIAALETAKEGQVEVMLNDHLPKGLGKLNMIILLLKLGFHLLK